MQKSLLQVARELFNVVEGFGLSEFAFNEALNSIRREHIIKMVKKYNVLNMRNHDLNGRTEYGREGIKHVYSDEIFNFAQVEEEIRQYFAQFTKADRIKEVFIPIEFKKTFGDKNSRYFSMWDFKKDKTEEQIRQEVTFKILESKKICLDKTFRYNYEYEECLNDLITLFNLMFDLNIKNTSESMPSRSSASVENIINSQQNLFKIQVFQEWIYISFTDKNTEMLFKQAIIEDTLRRIAI